MRALSAEGILSLKPSWMIAIHGSGPPDALKLVSDTRVPLTMIHDDPSPGGVAAKIETIGKLLGAEEKARTLANETRARFALVEHMRPQTAKPPPCFSSCRCRMADRWSGVAGRQPMRLSALAGGANAADTIEGYKPMTDEGVIAAAPDVILKMNTLVGIVAPHAVRLIVGPDHRALLPLSVALGATLLSGADVLARTWVTPAEMPIGILTAAVGAPFFLWLLMRRGGGFGI